MITNSVENPRQMAEGEMYLTSKHRMQGADRSERFCIRWHVLVAPSRLHEQKGD